MTDKVTEIDPVFLSALRKAIADGRKFVVCIDGEKKSMLTLHNLHEETFAARLLERHARNLRGS